MSNQFPKQYVLDRIDARMGSLNIKIEQSQKLITEAKLKMVGQVDAVMQSNADLIKARYRNLKEAEKKYAEVDADDYDAKSRIATEFTTLDLKRLPYFVNNFYRIGNAESLGNQISILTDLRKERTALTHARLHLETMPVSEFSLSTLRSLGLLSVLKFDLATAISEAK